MMSLSFVCIFLCLICIHENVSTANPDGSCTNPKFRWFVELDAFYDYTSTTGNNQTIPAVRVNISLDTAARCLDGSQYFFYFRPGFGDGLHQYHLYLQGGGWCTSYESCYQRAQPNSYVGSSLNYGDYAWFSADYLDDNATTNPLMHNWNTAWLIYCDGSSFTGNNMTVYPYKANETFTQNLYFRGHENLKQAMTVLYNELGLNTASDVVLSGCSAGGMAVYLHNDWILDTFIPSQAAAKFMSIPQSGFFPFSNPFAASTWYQGIRWIYDTQNVTQVLNTKCTAHYQQTNASLMYRCMFSEFVAPFLNQNKMFALQSIYDSAVMAQQNIGTGDDTQATVFGEWYSQLFDAQYIRSNDQLHAALLYSCASHCGVYNHIKVSGLVAGDAIQRMYDQELPSENKFLFQYHTFPCNECCFPDYNADTNFSVCKPNNEKCDPYCSEQGMADDTIKKRVSLCDAFIVCVALIATAAC